MDTQIIRFGKQLVETNNLDGLKEYVAELQEDSEAKMDWPLLFQKVYLHACLKGSTSIADWMKDILYPMMDPIQKIALRQVFPYGRYLLQRAKKDAT